MNNYYQYVPCPGTTGGIFYSNVGPAWTQPGPYINFTTPPDPEKVPMGGCYRVAIVQLESLPSGYVQIDWNTITGFTAPTCEDCNNFPPTEPCLNCPAGYILQEGDCIQEQFLPAVYTGGLLEVQAGARSGGYGSFGLRLYPDISSYVFPLYGNGATVVGYTVRDNNGAGVVVPTLLGAWGSPLLSNLWGMYDTGSGCPATGQTGGRLNTVGVWTTPAAVNDYPPYDTPICFEFCVTIDTPKQYLIGIAGDNKVEISINGVQTVFLDVPNGNITVPFFYWHVFPYTFTIPGEYTIKVCGINLQNFNPNPQPTIANFGAEIYDIDLATFQATLTTPATAPPNCGNVALDLEPYIIFSTRDYIGQSIADPDNPGDWTCPEGSILDECNGVPQCVYTVSVPTLPCGYEFVPCCGGDSVFYQISEGIPLTENATYLFSGTGECYTVSSYNGPALALPFQIISISELTEIDNGCNDLLCQLPCVTCFCTRIRYTLGSGTPIDVDYYDCDSVQQLYTVPADGSWGPKVCMKNYSLPEGYEAEGFGDCVLDSDEEYICPPCYILEDCEGIVESIYSLDPALDVYADTNQSIMIAGSTVCWKVLTSSDPCECAVATTVTYVYNNCEDCKKRKGYKLTECTTGAIIYTTTDLSAYEFVFITTDCPGCWYVEPIDFVPPTDQPVTIVEGYDSCELCNATYYELIDCSGVKDNIITIDDLSDYVGKVIKIKYCPETCWEVNTTTPQDVTGTVYFDEKYIDCPACLLSLPAQCVTFTNTLDNLVSIDYVNAVGQIIKVDILAKGTTPKTCAVSWNIPITVIVTNYGECTDGQCPVIPQPKRQVTPGYDTAACSTEYYEKVECTFSELMYKDVLTERYGISNCCPEEDMKWIIKHEMLMLDVLINPDYNCTPTTTCDCPVIGATFLNTACPQVTSYILEKCNEPEVTEVVRLDNKYNVLGSVIVIDGICYTVAEPTNRLVTVYWTPGTIYGTCASAGCPPDVSYNCVDTITCVQYECTIIPLDGGTLFYKDCEGVEQQQSFPIGKNPFTVYICSIPNATSNDIYVTGSPFGFTFIQTPVICESSLNCVEVIGSGGTYQTLEECEAGCQPLVPRCMSYVVDQAPLAGTYVSVTYKDCNGNIVITPQEIIGEDGFCYQFCASEDVVPIVTLSEELVNTQYPLDPIRECTPNDASPCIGVNFRVSTPGTGTVTYTDCSEQTQIITYDGTEPIGHLTYACLAPPYDYIVSGTVDIKQQYGTCQC